MQFVPWLYALVFFNNIPETKTQPGFHKYFLENGYIKHSPVLSPSVSVFARRFCVLQYRSFYLGIIINLLLSIFAVGHAKML